MSDPEDANKPPKTTMPVSEARVNAPHADATASDVVLLHSPTEDGKGVRVLRAREGRIEAGEIRAVESGRPLQGDIVRLKPREKTPQICDVEVQYAHTSAESTTAAGDTKSHVGPAKVASAAYRTSWDRIFGESRKDDLN